MYQLSTAKRAHILQLLMENTSMRGAARIAGVDVHTVMNLMVEAGKVCETYHDATVKNINAKRIQCDELWSFCYVKNKNVPPEKQGELGYGDAWAWVAIDADTRLTLTWLIGPRNGQYAETFAHKLASRLALNNRFQLTTDGFRPYIDAIEKAFGGLVDYGMLVKQYNSKGNYLGSEKRRINGNPDMDHISTSYVERQNLSIRMVNRRFSRRTEAFSKKFENHICALNLTFMYLNFIKIHKTLKVTPAMEAGVTNRLWSFQDIVRLMPDYSVP
jgi:IS1 family transposase